LKLFLDETKLSKEVGAVFCEGGGEGKLQLFNFNVHIVAVRFDVALNIYFKWRARSPVSILPV
jgi:hypothetical protein